jgi:xanthine dehydrogenase iron-sulfur cluster and FAD-binding subunit A
MFYISIPLGSGLARKEQQWSAGLQIQGKRDYPAARIDSTLLNAFSLNDIDAKWWLAGAVAVGAAAAISAKDKNTTSALQQQQTQQAQQQAASQQSSGNTSPGVCPRPVNDPCRK